MQNNYMQQVMAIVPVCPIRSEAAHRSEMVSQLLFGETATLMAETKDFLHIRCTYDGYEGWCQRHQLVLMEQENTAPPRLLAADWVNDASLDGQPIKLSFGSPIDLFSQSNNIGKHHLSYLGNTWDTSLARFDADTIKAIATVFLNTAYLWGGRSVFGVDCSGFVQQVYRFFNIPLPRDAYQQANLGEVVAFLQETVCGDLAFFDNEEGRITHVGLLLGNDTILHASGNVRIDPIDNMGIMHSWSGQRTHRLRVIKRYKSLV